MVCDGDRDNLTFYDEWLNYKLNETDYLLAACIKYPYDEHNITELLGR
jgi:hypothetical protein